MFQASMASGVFPAGVMQKYNGRLLRLERYIRKSAVVRGLLLFHGVTLFDDEWIG